MISNRSFYTVIGLCIVTYLVGMVMIPLMDIDASQYASISREMMENRSYLQVFDLGMDYIDKPPMLFWLSSLSMRVFGVHDWAYRIPSFLFALLAVYATYRLALLFYRREIAQLSAMVLASCQALFLITHDVRCDTMLLGWVALSLWQMAAWYQTNKWKHFCIAFIAIACGMMTKGPIALMVPAFAFVPHFVLRREWKQLFRWEYIAGLAIIAVMLLPMSIGLYQQFDLHPGKIASGVKIDSGLRFYYWTQSFGRYTGENTYNELNYFTFLLENMLWSFLPWIVFFLLGLVFAVRELVLKKFKLNAGEEWFSAGGFIITYCILARSQAQLPHYIFVVFPLAAIITAKFLFRLFFTGELAAWKKPLSVFHTVVFALLWLVCIFLMAWPFKVPVFVPVLAALCLVAFFVILFSKNIVLPKILPLAFFTVIGVNVFLGTGFYPNVLKYQLGNDAAAFMKQRSIEKERVKIYGIYEGRALHFYAQHIFPKVYSREELGPADMVITLKDSLPSLRTSFPTLKVLHEGGNFGVTSLSLPFLDPAKRDAEVPKYVLLEL
ncbi:phospholipid carrier-dependent glycosyltransferase [Sediminibacterium roseum]|uniref:Phospholipid carrier-dependent glycosyltransferase n=1 Tax=Sediminibacterium roseum TaxID=1978412 RepID=A0ABW9ZXM5_9BACT|nr:glycosyltransferase family 39 protein [Sediminibacterium roseum]NCI49775.1 phospholipid carrier-dependent glycosyltransferase [Sediminibacterium roseum]